MNTYFVRRRRYRHLETLRERKNGRLEEDSPNRYQGTGCIYSEHQFCPLETLRKNGSSGTMDGRIEQIGQGIGIRKGLQKMADAVVRNVARPEEKTLMITHCNCPERAESVKRMVTSKVSVKDVVIMDTAGVSSMYANDGGVIVTI